MTIWEHSTKSNIIVASPQEPLEVALIIFGMHNFRHLPIIDGHALHSLLTIPSLLKGLTSQNIEKALQDPIKTWTNTHPTLASRDMPLKNALEALLVNPEGALIITDPAMTPESSIHGIFTLRDVIKQASKHLQNTKQTIQDLTTILHSKYQTKTVTLRENATLLHAMQTFLQAPADYIFLINDHQAVTSIITHDSIIQTLKYLLETSSLSTATLQTLTAKECAISNFLSLTYDTPISTLTHLMNTNNMNIALILNENGNLQTSFAEREITQILLQHIKTLNT